MMFVLIDSNHEIDHTFKIVVLLSAIEATDCLNVINK
jgi:hypothetical protein